MHTMPTSGALVVAGLVLLGGCTAPYRPPHFADTDAKFKGLIEQGATRSGAPLDVVLIHGMCTHDEHWADDAIARLVRQIDERYSPPPPSADARSRTLRDEVLLVQRTVSVADRELRFNAIVWSPLTRVLKRQLCYDQTNPSPVCAAGEPYSPTRATLNAKLKDGLMDDCLADALIYQGKAGIAIRQHLRNAILKAVGDPGGQAREPGTLSERAAAQRTPLVVISESLGSKMLFDTLLDMSQDAAAWETARAAQNTIDRIVQIYMGANQLPILHLADQDVIGAADERIAAAPPARSDSLHRLLASRSPRAKVLVPEQAPVLTIVAFSDPNDLLSYSLRKSSYEWGDTVVVDVLVSNDWTYVGLFERPDTAHTGYRTNGDVASIVACGRPKSSLCR